MECRSKYKAYSLAYSFSCKLIWTVQLDAINANIRTIKMASFLSPVSVRILAIALDRWQIWINPTSIRSRLADSYNIFLLLVQRSIVYMHFKSRAVISVLCWFLVHGVINWWTSGNIIYFAMYFKFQVWEVEDLYTLHRSKY